MKGAVDLLQRHVDRQDGHRGPGVGQGDDDRGRVVEQELQRTGNDPERDEPGVDDAVVAEDHLPREDAEQVAGPEGNRDQDDPHHLVLLDVEGDVVRERIGQHDGDQRHQGGDADGAVEDEVIDLLLEERGVVLRGEGPDDVDVFLLPEAHRGEDEQGEEQPEHDHHQGRRQQRIASRRLAPHEPHAHTPARRRVGGSPRGIHGRATCDGATGACTRAEPGRTGGRGVEAGRGPRSDWNAVTAATVVAVATAGRTSAA